jgi:hypothetical protein
MEPGEGIEIATVTINPVPGAGDPTGVREKNLTGEARIKSLTEDFVGVAKSYGMKEENIEVTGPGEITLKRPNKEALAAAKYTSYTRLSPYIPSL